MIRPVMKTATEPFETQVATGNREQLAQAIGPSSREAEFESPAVHQITTPEGARIRAMTSDAEAVTMATAARGLVHRPRCFFRD